MICTLFMRVSGYKKIKGIFVETVEKFARICYNLINKKVGTGKSIIVPTGTQHMRLPRKGNIMKCPECGCEESKVIDSRPTENKVRRRRECTECGCRFTTYEIIEEMPLMVIKKDNTIEPFDREKLVDRLCRAAVKRPVKLETIENMVEEIAAELKNSLQREVTSDKIGELVLHKLKDIDHVAYIRFASVYRDFNDAESFIKIISELNGTEAAEPSEAK